jgi:hypothetical protein
MVAGGDAHPVRTADGVEAAAGDDRNRARFFAGEKSFG